MMSRVIPLASIGGAMLASALALGFLGAGMAALRLPQGVLPAPAADALSEAAADAPETEPAPVPAYIALRDPITVAHPAGLGTVGVELGVLIDAPDRALAQLFLRDAAGAVNAPLGALLLHLIETHAGGADGWSDLRAALPGAVLQVLNDRFEQAGEGRPVREVLVIEFTAR